MQGAQDLWPLTAICHVLGALDSPRCAFAQWSSNARSAYADIDWKALGAESAKLSALAQDRGWFYDAHRALVDCHALLQVLASPQADGGGTGLGRLIAAAGQPSYSLRPGRLESRTLLSS